MLDVAAAIVKVQRDFGNRADRKVARLKYLIANRGLDWFKAKVEEYYGQPLRHRLAHHQVAARDQGLLVGRRDDLARGAAPPAPAPG